MIKNYTPAPWVDIGNGCDISDDGGFNIAEVADIGDRQEEYANAKLIAAAPDLVEAIIEDAKKRANNDYNQHITNLSPTQHVLQKWTNYLSPASRAALTKAGIIKD